LRRDPACDLEVDSWISLVLPREQHCVDLLRFVLTAKHLAARVWAASSEWVCVSVLIMNGVRDTVDSSTDVGYGQTGEPASRPQYLA
jgi:hypothetical protein